MDIDDNSLDNTFFKILSNISSNNRNDRFLAVQSVRKILSVENNPPIDRVINSGLVPILHKYLNDLNDKEIQYEASWALTNIASGSSEHTSYIVENEIHKSIIDLLSTTGDNVDFLEQNIWALGNIIGDSPVHRDEILNEGIVVHIIDILKRQTKRSLISNISWTISNMCRGNPRPSFHHIKPLLPSIKSLLEVWIGDDDILSDTLWALSFLTETTVDEKDVFQSLIDLGLVDIIIAIVDRNQANSVTTPGFRTLGNMLSGSDDVTEVLLSKNVLNLFPKFLKSTRPSMIKEGYWCLSNITSGPKDQIQRVIDQGLLLDAIKTGSIETNSTITIEVKRELLWVIINAISGGTQQQIQYLIDNNCLEALSLNFEIAKSNQHLFQYYLDSILMLIKRATTITMSTKSSTYFNKYFKDYSTFIHEISSSDDDDDDNQDDEFQIYFDNIEEAFQNLNELIKTINNIKDSNINIIDKLLEMDISNE